MLPTQSKIYAVRYLGNTVFRPTKKGAEELRREVRTKFYLRYAEIQIDTLIVRLTKAGLCNILNCDKGATK